MRVIGLLAALLVLSGCGLKGPLTLPAPVADPAKQVKEQPK